MPLLRYRGCVQPICKFHTGTWQYVRHVAGSAIEWREWMSACVLRWADCSSFLCLRAYWICPASLHEGNKKQYGGSSKKKKKIKPSIPYGPAISIKYIPKVIERRDLNRHLYTSVHSSISHSSQKVETKQVPIHHGQLGGVDSPEVYIHTMENSSAFRRMDILTHAISGRTVKSKWNQPGTKRQIFYDSLYMRYLIIL